MAFLDYISRTLIALMTQLGLYNQKPKTQTVTEEYETSPEGTHGTLDSGAAFIIEDDKAVLTIEHDFEDVPSWIEWDKDKNEISIVQMGGAVATIDIHLPFANDNTLKSIKRIAFVSGTGPKKMLHYLTFISRN